MNWKLRISVNIHSDRDQLDTGNIWEIYLTFTAEIILCRGMGFNAIKRLNETICVVWSVEIRA